MPKITAKEKALRHNNLIHGFYRRNSELLNFKMPPTDIGNYLVKYDEKKYKKFGNPLVYGRFVSPWLYDESILGRYKEKVMFHATSQASPLENDNRFLVFIVQADSDSDTHVVLSASSADLSSYPNVPEEDYFRIFVSMEVYARNGENFLKIMGENEDIHSDLPDIDDIKSVGFSPGDF